MFLIGRRFRISNQPLLVIDFRIHSDRPPIYLINTLLLQKGSTVKCTVSASPLLCDLPMLLNYQNWFCLSRQHSHAKHSWLAKVGSTPESKPDDSRQPPPPLPPRLQRQAKLITPYMVLAA